AGGKWWDTKARIRGKRGRENVQLPLNDESTRTDDNPPTRVLHDEYVVRAARLGHPLKPLDKGLARHVSDRRQHAQAVEEARVEVRRPQRADGVARGQGGGDLRREEVGREEAVGRHCVSFL